MSHSYTQLLFALSIILPGFVFENFQHTEVIVWSQLGTLLTWLRTVTPPNSSFEFHKAF